MSANIAKTDDITDEQRVKIVTMLVSGEYPSDAEIAKAADVPTRVVTKMLKSDPELAELRRQGELEMAQLIEKASIDLATNGRNEMARQRAQEFMLRKLMPEKYGDSATGVGGGKQSKMVNIVLNMPEVKVDKDGIPIGETVDI